MCAKCGRVTLRLMSQPPESPVGAWTPSTPRSSRSQAPNPWVSRPPTSIRWGFGDAVWTIVVGIVAALIAGGITLVVRHPDLAEGVEPTFDAMDTSISAIAQFGCMALMIWLLVHRRGRGMRNDLGVRWAWADAPWIFAGIALPFAIGVTQLPITKLWEDGNRGKQQIGSDLQASAAGWRMVLIITIVVVTPVIEEIVFRGIVLRAALRRMHAAPAVIVSGLSFASLHLLDFATFPSFPALFVLGTLSAVVAVRSGGVSRSILMHVGFNLVGAIALLLTAS